MKQMPAWKKQKVTMMKKIRICKKKIFFEILFEIYIVSVFFVKVMEKQIRKNIRLVRNFFADHCKNPDIDVKTTARDEDVGILMGIPFFPNEYVRPPHNPFQQQNESEPQPENPFMEIDQESDDEEEDVGELVTYRPNDCLAHVAARFQNFVVLRAIVDLFGEGVLYQEDDYKIMPLSFLIACRATRTFPQHEEDWIRQIIYNRVYETNGHWHFNPSNININNHGIMKLKEFSPWPWPGQGNVKVYQRHVHLIRCARFHGFVFEETYQITQYIRNLHNKLEPIFVLEQALKYLPRERWIGQQGGILNTVMEKSLEMSTESNANVAIEAFLVKCMHHFSAEEWQISDISNGYCSADWFSEFRYHKHIDNGFSKGFDEQVLMEAFVTFPLLFFKGKRIYHIIEKNLEDIMDALRTLTDRMITESEETILEFIAPEDPKSHENKSFFTAFTTNGYLDPEDFFTIFHSLFRYHSFLFPIAKEQLGDGVYLDIIESLEGEQMVIDNVFSNLYEKETSDEILKTKQWEHPLSVLSSIVGRETDFQRTMQTEERRLEILDYQINRDELIRKARWAADDATL